MPSKSTAIHRRQRTGLLFAAPAIALFLVFAAWPIARSFILGFQEYRVVGDSDWAGIDNFASVVGDPFFARAWWNTAYFAFLALLLGFPVPIALAITINEVRRGQAFLRLAYFLPVVLPIVVVALLWERFYDVDDGIFNVAINGIGLGGILDRLGETSLAAVDPRGWINDKNWAMPSLVFMATWKGAGATMLIYLAALQSLSGELYEAAEIDGASVFQRLRRITLPHLVPTMQIILVLQLLGTLQVFLEPFLMTRGGPGDTQPTLTVLLLIYRYAFNDWNLSWAAAVGFILFLALVTVALIQRLLSRQLGGAGSAF